MPSKKTTDHLLKVYGKGSYLSPALMPVETENDRNLLENELNHWVETLETAKWPLAIRWFTHVAFLLGNQYPQFRWEGGLLDVTTRGVRVDLPSEMASVIPRTVANQLIRPVESNVSMLTERRPTPRIEPASDDPQDEDAATLGETAFDVIWEYLDVPEKLRMLGYHLCVEGTAGMEPVFGETGYPIVGSGIEIDESDGVVSAGPGALEAIAEERDLQVNVWNAYQMTPDPGATDDPDSMTWFYTQSYMDLGVVTDQYDRDEEFYLPKNLPRVKPSEGHEYPLYWWDRIKDLIDAPEGWTRFSSKLGSTGSGFAPNQLIVRKWHCKPNAYYPQGRTLVQAGDVLVYAGPAEAWTPEYPRRWKNMTVFRYWRIPGRFWGQPLLAPLLPLQKRINAIDSLVQLNREYMTIGQWLVPNQAKVPDGVLSGIPGQEIKYNPLSSGVKPEKVKHEGLPPELIGEREYLLMEIDRLATGDAGADPSGSGLRAGVMLEFLRKRQMASQSPRLQDFEAGLEDVGQNVLIELATADLSPDSDLARRIVSAAAKHPSLAIRTFLGSDLRDNVNVRLDIASELVKSPEALQQRAVEMIQYAGPAGLLTKAGFEAMMRKAGFDDFPTETSSDYERARRMVAAVLSGDIGAATPLTGIDDPSIFREVIKATIQSGKFVEAPERAQLALYSLYEFYAAQEQAQRAAQLQLEMALRGGSSGGGSASRPPRRRSSGGTETSRVAPATARG